MRRELPAQAVVTFLMEVYPLIRQARGEQGDYLRKAFTATINGAACAGLGVRGDQLPQSPRAAAEELLRQAIQIARAQGIRGVALSDFFNDTVDGSALALSPDPDDTLLATHALLAWLAARRLDELNPINPEQKEAS